MRKLTILLIIALAMLAGCADVDPIDEGGETQPGATAPATTPATEEETADSAEEEEVEEEVAVEEEDAEAEGLRAIDFDQPFTHEGPASMSVLAIRFMSRQQAEEQAPEIGNFFEDSTQALVSLKVEATNNSEQPFDWYPNQDALVMGDEQVDAAVFISDDVSGENWQPGVKKEGTIHWESRQSFDELVQLGSVRYLVGAPFSSEEFEAVGEDFEIEITWTP